MLASEGIATFLASGDNGAEGCQKDGVPATQDVLCVAYPASDPDVSAVGGTTTVILSDGRLAGPITAWGVQTELLGSNGATGGGVSAVFGRPKYQQPVAGIVGAARGLPDIALNADLITGDAVVIDAFDPNTIALGAVSMHQRVGPRCRGDVGARVAGVPVSIRSAVSDLPGIHTASAIPTGSSIDCTVCKATRRRSTTSRTATTR